MAIQVTVGEYEDLPLKDGEELTTRQNTIIKSLLANSVNRTLSTAFSVENQHKIAEELGYRRALLEFSNYFSSQENI